MRILYSKFLRFVLLITTLSAVQPLRGESSCDNGVCVLDRIPGYLLGAVHPGFWNRKFDEDQARQILANYLRSKEPRLAKMTLQDALQRLNTSQYTEFLNDDRFILGSYAKDQVYSRYHPAQQTGHIDAIRLMLKHQSKLAFFSGQGLKKFAEDLNKRALVLEIARNRMTSFYRNPKQIALVSKVYQCTLDSVPEFMEKDGADRAYVKAARSYIRKLTHAGQYQGFQGTRNLKLTDLEKKFADEHVFISPFEDPQPALDAFFAELVTRVRSDADPIEVAAFAHMGIVVIHPYAEGNGRTARHLMNAVLIAKGQPPVIFLNEREYTKSLEPQTDFVAKNFENLLRRLITEHRDDLEQLSELSNEDDLSTGSAPAAALVELIQRLGRVVNSSQNESLRQAQEPDGLK